LRSGILISDTRDFGNKTPRGIDLDRLRDDLKI